jgi:hypothetical protein
MTQRRALAMFHGTRGQTRSRDLAATLSPGQGLELGAYALLFVVVALTFSNDPSIQFTLPKLVAYHKLIVNPIETGRLDRAVESGLRLATLMPRDGIAYKREAGASGSRGEDQAIAAARCLRRA